MALPFTVKLLNLRWRVLMQSGCFTGVWMLNFGKVFLWNDYVMLASGSRFWKGNEIFYIKLPTYLLAVLIALSSCAEVSLIWNSSLMNTFERAQQLYTDRGLRTLKRSLIFFCCFLNLFVLVRDVKNHSLTVSFLPYVLFRENSHVITRARNRPLGLFAKTSRK